MAVRAGMLIGSVLLLQLLVPMQVSCISHDVQLLLQKCVYNIKVIAAPVKGSAKNTTVGITFYNSKAQEASFAAIPTSQEPERYATDEFYHSSSAATCLRDICKMRVQLDKFDAGTGTPRVFLTFVEVGTLQLGEGKRRFDVNGWLAIDEPPFLIDRTFDLCSWTTKPLRTMATTMAASIATQCTTNSTTDGSTTTTSSLCTSNTTTEL